MTTASSYLQEPLNFGGEMVPRGRIVATLAAEGYEQGFIDRWLQGAEQAQRRRALAADRPVCRVCGCSVPDDDPDVVRAGSLWDCGDCAVEMVQVQEGCDA